MNNNEEVVITSQENGPVGSTVENVPPAQETAKEDENVESKEVSTPAKEDINTEIVSEDKKEENDVEPVEKVVVTETVKEVIVTETVEETSASGNEKKIVEVVETVTETTTTVVEKEKSSEEELKIDEEPPVPLNCEEEKNLLNNEAKEVNNEKKEDKVDSLEEEQKVDEIMEATKNNESVSETPLDEKEEEDTTTAIRTSSRRKRITAVQEAESTPKSRPRRGVTVKEDVEEEPTPAKRGRKVQKNLKATNDDEEVTEESAKTPSTGRRGRKPASKVQEEVVEDEEEPMEVDDEVEIKTPKKTKGQNKKGGVKRKNNEEPQTEIKKAKADNDAYDIDNIDDHPDISDSFKVERQSNGGAKFLATSNPKRGRFQEIEKAAKERNADSFIENSEEAEDLGEKKSISVLTLSDKKLVSQIDDEKTPKGKTPKTSKVNKTTAKTPKSVAKSTTVKATPKATPAKNIIPFIVPEMKEESQVEVDTKFEMGEVNQYARVYASFSGVCYAAIATGKSTISSFEVQFIGDKIIKNIARNGIYRLKDLTVGLDVDIVVGDDEENTFEGTIKSIPDPNNASEFVEAKFTVEKKDEDGQTSDVVVTWDKIILEKAATKVLNNVETETKNIGKTPRRRTQL